MEIARANKITPSCRLLRQQHLDGCFIRVVVSGAHKVPNLLPVLPVKNRRGDRSVPSRQYRLNKRVLFTLLLAVVREDRLVTRQEPSPQDHVAILVQAAPPNFHALWPILLPQLVQNPILLAAPLAQQSPKRHHQPPTSSIL